MTTTRKFDDRTHWDVWDKYHGVEGWSKPGWALPGDPTRYIGLHDPCWDRVLNRARAAYGDPNIHYNTNTNIGEERWLVFGDGTRLPADGSLAYHDSYTKKTYLLNDDGSVVPLDANGQGGQAFLPAGFRKAGDGKYAPIDPTAQQVAPLLDNPPPSANGYHDEKGVLTPKNAHGDYYVDDPATRKRAYYDGAGHPISEQQFRDGANTSAGAPGGAAPPQDELKNRYSHISAAEEQLSEALPNAHATTAEGQRKLNDIQKKIVEAVNNPALSLDTPAGEEAFLTFLRTQVAAIGDVLVSGTLSADDQSKAIAAPSNLYAAHQGDTGSPRSPGA